MDCRVKYGRMEGDGKISMQHAIRLSEGGDIFLRFRPVKIGPGEMSKEEAATMRDMLRRALELVEGALG